MNNIFSVKRILRLLAMELRLEWRHIVITPLVAIVVIALSQAWSGGEYQTTSLYRGVLTLYIPIVLFATGIAYFVRVHSLIHEEQILPFVSIPLTTLEKYLMTLLLGVIYYTFFVICIQCTYWAELALHPNLAAASRGKVEELFLIGNSHILNPLFVFQTGTLFFIGTIMLTITLIPQKRYAYPLAFILPLLVFIAISYFITSSVEAASTPDSFLASGKMGPIAMSTIGGLSYVACYFALLRKQVKS